MQPYLDSALLQSHRNLPEHITFPLDACLIEKIRSWSNTPIIVIVPEARTPIKLMLLMLGQTII